MAAKVKDVKIYVTPLVIETGLWCDHCNLPSAVLARMKALYYLGTPRAKDWGLMTFCIDCETVQKMESDNGN